MNGSCEPLLVVVNAAWWWRIICWLVVCFFFSGWFSTVGCLNNSIHIDGQKPPPIRGFRAHVLRGNNVPRDLVTACKWHLRSTKSCTIMVPANEICQFWDLVETSSNWLDQANWLTTSIKPSIEPSLRLRSSIITITYYYYCTSNITIITTTISNK